MGCGLLVVGGLARVRSQGGSSAVAASGANIVCAPKVIGFVWGPKENRRSRLAAFSPRPAQFAYFYSEDLGLEDLWRLFSC